MIARLAVLLIAAACAASAADRDFDRIVKQIESHYGVKPTHIPFMGLASFVVKTGHPEGVSGFRLATFENLDGDAMDGLAVKDMHPMVEVHSRRDGEATYIYAGEPGKSTEMIIATFEQNEATVIQVKVDVKTLARLLEDPRHMGDELGKRAE